MTNVKIDRQKKVWKSFKIRRANMSKNLMNQENNVFIRRKDVLYRWKVKSFAFLCGWGIISEFERNIWSCPWASGCYEVYTAAFKWGTKWTFTRKSCEVIATGFPMDAWKIKNENQGVQIINDIHALHRDWCKKIGTGPKFDY